jgi:hypothetical protein
MTPAPSETPAASDLLLFGAPLSPPRTSGLRRLLPPAVLLGLLVATAAAFAITERLKLEQSPVFGTQISRYLSSTCGCARGRAKILIKLRQHDVVTLMIRDARRGLVDTLATGSARPRGVNVFYWNGRTANSGHARDGTYYVEVHLAHQHRTLLLPNRIMLDTVPPQIDSASSERPAFSPDGDRQVDSVKIRYALSQPAFALAYLRGRRIVRTRFHRTLGSFTWAGMLGSQRLPPGIYALSIGAVDLAGNSTPVARRATVRVQLRYITLASHRIAVAHPGERVEIGVSTDARRYAWRLRSRHGFAPGPLLSLPAPSQRGRYQLIVTEHGHSDRAVVTVR